jgi:hypothetical protein
MNIYETLLRGRPFQKGVPGNPYAGVFADLVLQAQSFTQQFPRIQSQGTLSRRTQSQGFTLPGDGSGQYQRQAPPEPKPFGGM